MARKDGKDRGADALHRGGGPQCADAPGGERAGEVPQPPRDPGPEAVEERGYTTSRRGA